VSVVSDEDATRILLSWNLGLSTVMGPVAEPDWERFWFPLPIEVNLRFVVYRNRTAEIWEDYYRFCIRICMVS